MKKRDWLNYTKTLRATVRDVENKPKTSTVMINYRYPFLGFRVYLTYTHSFAGFHHHGIVMMMGEAWGERCQSSIKACGNRGIALVIPFRFTLLHANSTFALVFTIPWLDGSMPLHSIVILIQGVETDSV